MESYFSNHDRFVVVHRDGIDQTDLRYFYKQATSTEIIASNNPGSGKSYYISQKLRNKVPYILPVVGGEFTPDLNSLQEACALVVHVCDGTANEDVDALLFQLVFYRSLDTARGYL